MGEVLRIHLFGEPHLLYGGATHAFSAPPKTLPLLAYLLLHRHAPVARASIAAALWPESEHAEALGNVRRHLHYLNKALPQSEVPWVLADIRSVAWNAAAPYWLDVEVFETESQDRRYRARAARLYSADLYERCADEWIFFDRERLRTLQMSNLALLSAEARERNAYLQALQYAQLMLALDPWREDALRSVIDIRALLGDGAGAAAEYERFAERLKRELGVEPSEESARLYARLRSSGAAVKTSVRDTGAIDAMPIVGRRNETAMLNEAWQRATQGRGHFVLVGGEAGIGKTTLLKTLAATASADGAAVLRGASGSDSPYQAFVDVLRQAGGTGTTIAEIARGGDADAGDRLRFFDTIAQLLAAEASRPLLILLEDVHASGAAALDLLRYLITRLADKPVLFAATYREYEVDRSHPLRSLRRQLARTGHLTHLAVPPLDRESARELVRAQAGRPIDDAAIERIYTATNGNPLFMIEVVRQLAHGDLESIPSSVATIVRARLDALSAQALMVAETAAIAGRHCSAEQLAQVTGLSEGETIAAFDELVERHIVRESSPNESGEFTFVHDIVREAVYGQIPKDALRRRHARFGLALQDFYEGDAEQPASAVARHLELGELPAEAARAYADAAETALRVHALDEATYCASKVRELGDAPDLQARALFVLEFAASARGAREEQRAALEALAQLGTGLPEPMQIEELCRRCEFLAATNDARAEEALEQLARLCKEHPELHARYLSIAGEFSQLRGKHDRALEQLQEAYRLFRDRGETQRALACFTAWLNARVSTGNMHPRVVDEIEPLQDSADPRTLALLAYARGRALFNYDAAGAYAAGEQMLQAARMADDRWLEALAYRMMGSSAGHQNRLSPGERYLERSAELIIASGRPYEIAVVRYHQIQLANRAAYSQAAYEFAEDGLRAARACGSPDLEVRIESNLADSDIAAGYLEQAMARCKPVLENAVRFGLGGVRPSIVYLIGQLEVALESPQRGIDTLLESRRMAAEFGINLSHYPAILGLAYLCAGDEAKAMEQAADLRGRLPELAGQFFLPQAYLWAGAQLFHFLGLHDDALAFGEAAYLRYAEMLEQLQDGPMREAFLQYTFNRAIVALRERGTWAADPLTAWFRPASDWDVGRLRGDDAPAAASAHNHEKPKARANR